VRSHEMDRVGGGALLERVTFDYGEITWEYTPLAAEGAAGRVTHSFTLNDTPTTDATGGPLGLAPSNGSPHLYLTAPDPDGNSLPGDSTTSGHEGDVVLAGTELLINLSGKGSVEHAPLVLEKTTDRATATMLAALHTGLAIPSVVIETCTSTCDSISMSQVRFVGFSYDGQQGETWEVAYVDIHWDEQGGQFDHDLPG
jgi:type VI protein secretion system component Hcp